MITVAYFFLLRPVEYTGSKSNSTPFRLKHIAFSSGFSVFATTSTEADFQAAAFVKLAFTTHNNGVIDKKIVHKASGGPLLCPKSALRWHVLDLRDKNTTPSTP